MALRSPRPLISPGERRSLLCGSTYSAKRQEISQEQLDLLADNCFSDLAHLYPRILLLLLRRNFGDLPLSALLCPRTRTIISNHSYVQCNVIVN